MFVFWPEPRLKLLLAALAVIMFFLHKLHLGLAFAATAGFLYLYEHYEASKRPSDDGDHPKQQPRG